MSKNKKSLICFPNELIENILLRLSPNHLSHLKLTCKHLKLLIESPRFVDYYHKQAEEQTDYNSQLVSFITHEQIHTIELEKLLVGKSPNINMHEYYHAPKDVFPLMVKGSRILGSCNGILCFASSSGTISLYNPSTQAHYTFPCPLPEDHHTAYCLYGFGYDRSTYDYKVVCIVWGFAEGRVYVCSLKTKSWKLTQVFPKGLINSNLFYPRHSIFVNNALHWPAVFSYLGSKSSTTEILCFDLSSEELSFFPLQREIQMASCRVVLDVLNGYLSAFYRGTDYITIWVMEKYGVKESWTKLVTIQSRFLGKTYLITRSKDSSKLFLSELINNFGPEAKFYCYDIDSSKRIWDIEVPFMGWGFLLRTTQSKLTLPLDELKQEETKTRNYKLD